MVNQDQLIIYLHAHDHTRPSWVVMDATATITANVQHGNPEELAAIATGKIVIVIVPSEDVLLTQLRLPKMSRARLIQAIPFALEEQLISDVDASHFAYTQVDDEIAVAVVAKAKLTEWVNQLNLWGIQADKMLPVSLTLPYTAHTWEIDYNDLAIVRLDAKQSFVTEKDNLISLLKLALNSSATPPQRIHIMNYTNASLDLALDDLPIKEDFALPERWLPNMARQVREALTNPQRVNLDLLQGVYANKKSRLPQMQKIIHWMGTLALIWVALLFIYPTISYFILAQRVNAAQNQIETIYYHHFPQATTVVAPRMRMEEKLHQLNAQLGENKFLLLMGYVGKAMLDTPTVKLKHLEFQNNQLTLEMTAASSDDFSAFTDYLAQQGLNVKQQNADLNDTRVSATLVID